MKDSEILQQICERNGCTWATRNKGALLLKPKGFLFCALQQKPKNVLSPNGCQAATIKGEMDHMQGGDTRFGVMRKTGFTQNEDYINRPADHPLSK